MSELFTQASAQWGLGVGLLVVAVVGLIRFVLKLLREQKAQYEKTITDLEAERDLYRDRWVKAIDTAEVADEAATRLAGRRRRAGGS